MVGMGEISALAGSLKAASDLAKAMIGLRDAQAFQAKAIELQSAILSAQGDAMAAFTAHSELIEQVRALETKLAAFENWEAEKQRYQLQQLPPGVFVYTLKPDMAGGEPMHSICQACYQNGKKSILHAGETNNGVHHLKCHACDADLRVGHFSAPRMLTRARSDWP